MAKLKQDESKPMQPDMTPMIDCVFQLIIFFICSIKFKQVEGKLLSWLPKDKGSQQLNVPKPDLEEVKINLVFKNRQVELWCGNNKVRDMEELMTEVGKLLELRKQGGDEDPPVLLAPQPTVPLQPIIDVLSECKKRDFRPEFALLAQAIKK